MLFENNRYYSEIDDDKFLLLTQTGHLCVYSDQLDENGNYMLIWESTNENKTISQAPYTLIINQENRIKIVDANNKVHWKKSNLDGIPFDFNYIH